MITDEIIRESAFYKRIFKKGFEEGFEQGIARAIEIGFTIGIVEGRKQGRKEFLHLLLQEKFGTLPSDEIARLHSASLSDLETWGKRFVKASTLEEIFG